MADEVLKLLCSNAKLDRDRGVSQLESLLSSGIDSDSLHQFENSFQQLFGDSESSWESLHGAFMGCCCLIRSSGCAEEFSSSCKDYAIRHLTHNESRVRLAAGNDICMAD